MIVIKDRNEYGQWIVNGEIYVFSDNVSTLQDQDKLIIFEDSKEMRDYLNSVDRLQFNIESEVKEIIPTSLL